MIEGEPPDLKQQVMKKRIAQQYPPRGVPHNGVRHNAQKVRRRNFTADHKEVQIIQVNLCNIFEGFFTATYVT